MQGNAIIEFTGLFLFARSTDKKSIHVFCAQPRMMPHRSTLRYQNGKDWTAVEIPMGHTLEYGTATTASATLPDESQMSNVSCMPGGAKLPQNKAMGAKDARGAHVILHGGALTVKKEIGDWRVTGNPVQGQEFHFPYLVSWSGLVELNARGGILHGDIDCDASPVSAGGGAVAAEFWNAMNDDSPTLGAGSQPPKDPNCEQAASNAAQHFKAYYQILTNSDGPEMKMIGQSPCIKRRGQHAPEGITVSSCPLAQATLFKG